MISLYNINWRTIINNLNEKVSIRNYDFKGLIFMIKNILASSLILIFICSFCKN